MRDYMKALYHRFETPSRRAEYLDKKIKKTHNQLTRLLDKPGRKLLLRIADMEDELRDDSLPEQLHIWLPSGTGHSAGATGGPAAIQLRGRR